MGYRVGSGDITVNQTGGGAGPWIDVTASPFNAAGDGVTDDTGAIQAAIDSISWPVAAFPEAMGGTIYFPRGKYRIAGRLQMFRRVGITLLGEGHAVFQGIAYQATTLFFEAGGPQCLVDCRSGQSLRFENIGFVYTNPAFTGDVFNFARHPYISDGTTLQPWQRPGDFIQANGTVVVGPDAGRNRHVGCTITGGNVDHFVHIADTDKAIWARSLINYQESIFNGASDCHFGFARRHVIGKWFDYDLPPGSRPFGNTYPRLDPSIGQYSTGNFYSNGIWFERCEYNGAGIASSYGIAEAWSWDQCGWEFHHGMPWAILHTSNDPVFRGMFARGLSFTGGCWIGDAAPSQRTTLSAPMASGATTITLTSVAALKGPAVGQALTIGNTNRESRVVTGISGNTVTLQAGTAFGTLLARSAGEEVHNFWGNEGFFANVGENVSGASFDGIMCQDLPIYTSRTRSGGGNTDYGLSFTGCDATHLNAVARGEPIPPVFRFGGVSAVGASITGNVFGKNTNNSGSLPWIEGHEGIPAGGLFARANVTANGVAETFG